MKRRNALSESVLLLGALVLGLWPLSAQATPQPPEAAGEQALQRAAVGGKYRMLLQQIEVRRDADKYKGVQDLGLRHRRSYAGFSDLPTGYWVYVYPYWYIWRDRTSWPKPNRDWGPEQATGAPNTTTAGDMRTAWASKTPDADDEWLLLEYDRLLVPKTVEVYETYNPGAVSRITAFRLDGHEVEIWKGTDPTPQGVAKGVSRMPVKVHFKTKRIKIYLASKAVPGWNEIDAVGLVDRAGKEHWASSAEASSTYAMEPARTESPQDVQHLEDQVDRLEQEVRRLKAENDKLRARKGKEK